MTTIQVSTGSESTTRKDQLKTELKKQATKHTGQSLSIALSIQPSILLSIPKNGGTDNAADKAEHMSILRLELLHPPPPLHYKQSSPPRQQQRNRVSQQLVSLER